MERDVSPQRLVHYRDNWYLDAWCHLRDDLRNFSIDAIAQLQVLDSAAKEVAARTIDEALGAGYGIFCGTPRAWTKLQFTKERARWVERETWHPQQESHTEADGSYVVSVTSCASGPMCRCWSRRSWVPRVQKGLLEAVGKYV